MSSFKNELLSIEVKNNVKKVEVLKECIFYEYLDALIEYENLTDIKIPVRTFIVDNNDFMSGNIEKQKIFFIFFDNHNYSLAIGNDGRYIMSKRIYQENDILEVEIKIDENNDFEIIKYIHDNNESTKLCKTYPGNSALNECFILDKEDAIQSLEIFLEDFDKIEIEDENSPVSEIDDLVNGILNSLKKDKNKEKIIKQT